MNDTAWVKSLNPAELAPVAGIEGRWKRYVLPSADNCGMIVGLGELPPHTRMTWHTHPEPEVFCVIAGEGRAFWEIDGREFSAQLEPGRVFYKAGHVRHDMENTGDEPLRGIAFKIQPICSP